MSGAEQMRRAVAELRQAGFKVENNGHWRVHDSNGNYLLTLPSTPGTQRLLRESLMRVEKLLAGKPVYPERDHPTAPHGTRKVTGDSAVFPPGADQAGTHTPRADKPRFEPPSQDVGPLGYTARELFDRMPAPAPAVPRPRREFDPERKARDEADRIAASMWRCMRCGSAVTADQISPVRFRMNQAALLGDLAKLTFSTERAAWVARNTYRRDEDCYQVGMCQGCLNVTGLPEGMGRPRGTYATYADANTDVPPALDITASPPPAFRRRPAGPS